MIDTREIKACMAREGITQEKLAKMCNMTSRTFQNKMKKGIFGSDEIETMIDVLHIDEPMRIFFAKEVTR